MKQAPGTHNHSPEGDKMRIKCTMMAGAAVLAITAGGVAAAQDSDSSTNETKYGETIVVTAQKREQSLQDVPLAITAIGGDELNRRGVSDVESIANASPNIGFTSFFPSRPEIAIRGVSMSESFLSTDQQPTGVYHDDIFQGYRGNQLSQVFDLERVEIVRGPQGVLFGRNTTAGAISFISAKPTDEFSGYITAGYGNFDAQSYEGAMNVPLSEEWAFRASGMYKTDNGWAENLYTGNNAMDMSQYGFRALLQYSGDNMEWLFNFHGAGLDGDTNYYFTPNIGLAYDEIAQDTDKAYDIVDSLGASATGKIQLGDVELTTITGWESAKYHGLENYTAIPGGAVNLGEPVQFDPYTVGYMDDFNQISHEMRLAGSNGGLDWVAGVFGYYEDVDSIYSDGGFGTGTIGFDDPLYGGNGNGVIDQPDEGFFPEDDERIWNQKTKEAAGFVYGNYALNERLGIIAGVRYTYSEKELTWEYTDVINDFPITPQTTRKGSWGRIAARGGIEYRPTDEAMVYARYDRGFKSGGFSVGGSSEAALITLDPETVNTYEVGGKFNLEGGRVLLNLAAFYNKIKDFQANVVLYLPEGIQFAFENAAEVKSKGVEADATVYLTESLVLTGAFGYTDAEYVNYVTVDGDFSGHPLPLVPKYTANTSLTYSYELSNGFTIKPSADFNYQSETQSRHFNDPVELLEARKLLNARFEVLSPDERISVSLWGKNLLDEEYRLKRNNDVAFAGGIMEKRGRPRTYGVSVSYNW